MQESGDIAGAQAIILQELETQFGGAAAAAARTDPYTQLANEIGNLSEDFGKIISEALIPLVQFVQRAADAIKGWSDGTKQFVVVAGGLLAVLGPMLIVVGQLIAAYTTISGAIAAKAAAHAAEAVAANTATVAQIKLNLAVLANPYVAVAASILILVGAMVKLYKDTKSAEETVASLRDELKDLSAEEASREAEKAVMAQAKRVEELKESYETLSRTRAIGDANDQRMHANTVQRTKEELAKAEEVLGGMRQLQKQKESDAYWSAEATKRMAEMGKKQEEVNVTMGEAVQAQESIQSKLQQRVADIEAEFQVTSDLEEKVNALKDAYLSAAIEAQKLKDVNLSEELYQQFLATGRVEGGAMTLLAPIATPGAVPQVGGATPVPVLQDTTASTQRLNEALNALNAQDALARQAEEAAQFEALMQRLADTALQLGQSFGAAFGQLITGAEGGKDAMKAFASQAIDAAFMAASGFAIQAAAQSSLATGPAAAIVLPALITAGLAGLREVFRGITGLATGGLTTGPMLAMIGDNQSGKEAVIPFERMGEFLQMAGVGAQSNQNIVVQGRISGRDILISNQRTGRDANRYR